MNHINAHKVFSERIIREIQKYYSGGYLWIPKQDYKERNKRICVLYERGESVRNIAEKMNLTERRIRQIIQERTHKPACACPHADREIKLETELV
jgi:Mor family transcriptional regulator